jgi:osmotically-inducible protein OsmY
MKGEKAMLIRKTLKNGECNLRTDVTNISIALLVLATVLLPSLVLAAGIPDSDITYWVKDALHRDVRVESYDINVSTKDGVVTLSGSVDNLAAKKYADLEAKKVDGVLGVINRITVLPSWRSDTDIRNAVRRRILNSAVIESEGISVRCLNGKVTLSGKVDSYSEAKEAELLASEVRGVTDVENSIVTEWTTKRSDQEIKNDAVAALKRDVYLTDLPTAVTVNNGVVTLEGTVGSAYEKDRAYDDVRWIQNVEGVNNKLRVEWWEKRGVREQRPFPSDTDLNKAVRDALDRDIRLNASDISTKVSYGCVTLDGTVYTHYEKRIAEQDAHDVVGVGWVTNNLLARVDMREDWAVLDDVKFNLDTDATTEGLDIAVKVNNGVVTLSGSVNTWYERSHAQDVAGKVKGVKKVVNQIEIYRETTRTHTSVAVAKNIEEHLKRNWTVREVCDRINVTVEKGVATLTGEVDTWAQRRQAGEVAFNTEGVWKVDNRLQVKGYNYNWEDWYHEGFYPWYPW